MKRVLAVAFLAGSMATVGAAAPTIEVLRIEGGVSTVVLNNAENALLIGQITAFGATSRDFSRLPLTGPAFPVTGTGADVVIAADSAIASASGAGQAGIVSVVETSTGDFIVYDEAFRGGSDKVLRVTPTGTVTVEIDIDEVDPNGAAPGIEATAIASNDAYFAWNQFPATGGVRGLFIFPAPYSPGTRVAITREDVAAGVNAVVPDTATSGDGVRLPIGGMAIHEYPAPSTDIIVALSDINNNAIHGMTFDRNDLTAAPTYSVLIGRAQLQAFTGQAELDDVRQRTIAFDAEGNLYLYSGQGRADENAKLVKADVLTDVGNPTFQTIATQAELIAGSDAGYNDLQVNSIQVDGDGVIYMGLYGGSPAGRIIKVTPGTTNVRDWNLY